MAGALFFRLRPANHYPTFLGRFAHGAKCCARLCYAAFMISILMIFQDDKVPIFAVKALSRSGNFMLKYILFPKG